MTKIRESFIEITHDDDLRRKLYIITLVTALFIMVLAIRGPEEKGYVITDSDGRATMIRRNSLERSEQYDMSLSILDSGGRIDKDLTLNLQALPEAGGNNTDGEETRSAEIDAEVGSLTTGIEYSDEQNIALPGSLEDGTRLIWHERDTEDSTGYLLIIAVYIVLIAAVIKSRLDETANKEAFVRKEIMKGLPRFCNQLFLIMNAGMILSDAFERICESYMEYGEENMTWFERKLTEIESVNRDHRIGTARAIGEFAAACNVKELTRIATILAENEKRGSDVIESLSRESKYLWDDRKIVARENGKLIDTRLSYPLGMLLILLIVITMAPAMLNM